MFVALSLVKAGQVEYAMGIGADTSQGAPGDALEYSASAGAAAFIFGKKKLLAVCEETHSYMTDTPDFWRREYQFYPRHAGRFTGEPAYFKHILSCANGLMEKSGTKPDDFRWAVFHQPNGKFPMRIAKTLGFPKEKVETGLLTPRIGNTYSAASMLGLAAVLDKASPGERVLVVSYGSGAGSDAFDISVTDAIEDFSREGDDLVETRIAFSKYIDYAEYAKFRGKILMGGDGA